MRNDLTHAFTSLDKSPGHALAAVLTLALGIGANTAIFSVINDVLLRDLPYAEPQRLVMLWEEQAKRDRPMNVVSPANFLDWQDRATSFDGMTGFFDRSFTVSGEGDPEEAMATAVTTTFFDLLGVKPLLGRALSAEDGKPESPRAVILSHKYWTGKYGADPSVIGRKITLTGEVGDIVGVMPKDFGFYIKEASFNQAPPDFWLQARFDASHRIRRGRYMAVLGRMKQGVTTAQARAEMSTLGSALQNENPEFNRDWGINLVPLPEQLTAEIRPMLRAVFGAVCLTLLIACANVANLQLVRASARARELTVRAALGASRGRLVLQLLMESLALATVGGVLGLVVGQAGLEALQRLMPRDLLPGDYVGLDLQVLAFTSAVSLLSGLAFGMIPALFASNPHLTETLKDGARGASSARGRGLRQLFVVAQVAIAIVVLIGAGLLGRSFDRLVATDPGFDPGHILTARVNLPGASYSDPAKVRAFYEELIRRTRSLPGVSAVTGNVFAPFSGPGAATSFEVMGQKAPAGQEPVTEVRIVAADYFATLHIPLTRGRTFSPEEQSQGRGVVVINETLAQKHFPGRNPIGQMLAIDMGQRNPRSEVIGVVGDIRHERLDAATREMVYWPHSELPIPMMSLLVRTVGDPLQTAPALQREVWALDRSLPVLDPRSMEQRVDGTLVRARFATLLFGLFAALALVLAALGIFAVASYKVALETRDIGVRMALGANRGRVVAEVLANGGQLAAMGVAAGVVGALGLTRLLQSQLYKVSATDPVTFVIAPAFLMLIAVLACWPAARRAASVEPMAALRAE